MSKNCQTQHDHFVIRGHWWLPKSRNRVAGELNYSEGTLILHLYGGLSDATAVIPFGATPDDLEYSLIHGESEDHTPITLMRVFYTAWTPDITTIAFNPGSKVGLRSSRLQCRFLVDGVHLSSEDEKFGRCRVEIPNLDVWLGIRPFDIDMKNSFRRMSLEYQLPGDEQFVIQPSTCKVSFVHAVTPPELPFGPSPTISHHTYLEVEPSQPCSITQILKCSSDIVNLLSIFYGGPILSVRTMVYLPSDARPRSVFYPRHDVECRSFGTHDFLVRYEEIKDTFLTVLEQWMNSTNNLKRARRMLVSSERQPSKFMELRFLPLAHAVEVLSNDASHTTIIDPSVFRQIRSRMLEAVEGDLPGELTGSIKNSLQWANGRSFRDRLRSLLGELQDASVQLFLSDKEQFLAGLVKTRNHYTHYSTKAGEQILQGNELHWGIQKLALMIRVVLLVRAGVSESVLQAAVRSHVRLSQERNVWSHISEEGSEYAGDD